VQAERGFEPVDWALPRDPAVDQIGEKGERKLENIRWQLLDEAQQTAVVA
jgi:hypothetical protein